MISMTVHNADIAAIFEEIADLLERPIDEVKRMLGLNERVTSVDTPFGKDADKPLLDTISDVKSKDPTENVQNEKLCSNLDYWLSKLKS